MLHGKTPKYFFPDKTFLLLSKNKPNIIDQDRSQVSDHSFALDIWLSSEFNSSTK